MRSRRAPLTPLGTLVLFAAGAFVGTLLFGLLQAFEVLRNWATS